MLSILASWEKQSIQWFLNSSLPCPWPLVTRWDGKALALFDNKTHHRERNYTAIFLMRNPLGSLPNWSWIKLNSASIRQFSPAIVIWKKIFQTPPAKPTAMLDWEKNISTYYKNDHSFTQFWPRWGNSRWTLNLIHAHLFDPLPLKMVRDFKWSERSDTHVTCI